MVKHPVKKAHYERNKERILEQRKVYYQANRDQILAASRERSRRNRDRYLARRRSINRFLDSVKVTAGCVDCGFVDYSAALDFDHVDPLTKNGSPRGRQRWEPMLEELEKCVVRCANCHRIRTAKERHNVPPSV